MDIIAKPRRLKGCITLPESKSYLHRAIIAAALSERETIINCTFLSDDVKATLECVNSLGGSAVFRNGAISVIPISVCSASPQLNFHGSATSARLIIPVAATLCDGFTCVGDSSLCRRPMEPLREAVAALGTALSGDFLPLSVSGRLLNGDCAVDGSLSSQFISGLLFALCNIGGDSTLQVTGKRTSSPYVDMTLEVLKLFGQSVTYDNGSYRIHGSGYISPSAVIPPADCSLAAYYDFSSLFGSEVVINNPPSSTAEGDCVYKSLAESILLGNAGEIDITDTPDIFPILALTAAGSESTVTFTGTARLRFKESDRVSSTAALINSLGGRASIEETSVTVSGTGGLLGGVVDSFGDHRIALAGAFATAICRGPVTIMGAECVSKSYPSFFTDYIEMGGEYREI